MKNPFPTFGNGMQQVFRNSHSPLPWLVWQPLNWCCSSICDIWPIMTRVSHNPKVRTNSFTYVQFWRLKKRKFVQIWGISLTHETLDARSVWRRLQSLWSRSGATCNHLLIQLINWMNNLRNWTTSLLSCDLFQPVQLSCAIFKGFPGNFRNPRLLCFVAVLNCRLLCSLIVGGSWCHMPLTELPLVCQTNKQIATS